MGLKEKIFGTKDRQTVTIDVPEWGGVTLHLATMSGDERNIYELAYSDNCDEQGHVRSTSSLKITALILACRDEDGAPVFSEEDRKELGKKNGLVIDRIFDEVAALNKLMGEEEPDNPKNAGGEPGEDSSEGSLLL